MASKLLLFKVLAYEFNSPTMRKKLNTLKFINLKIYIGGLNGSGSINKAYNRLCIEKEGN